MCAVERSARVALENSAPNWWLLKNNQILSTRNRQARIKRLMVASVARQTCKDRVMWKSLPTLLRNSPITPPLDVVRCLLEGNRIPFQEAGNEAVTYLWRRVSMGGAVIVMEVLPDDDAIEGGEVRAAAVLDTPAARPADPVPVRLVSYETMLADVNDSLAPL
ncbi:hypothetical protein EVAR_9204_1 [Eumeta japonica]|uniref:Uncharacterized protein n=1 Tax=Eumeta variegata TaxID=151549 RepID=A0A4C1WP42_EUMVA|nr:hypothetical protein EVAR_9204_1 [Eumeta japonica]